MAAHGRGGGPSARASAESDLAPASHDLRSSDRGREAAAAAGRAARHRPRRGSLERPVSGRMYRGTWLLVGLPLLVSSFSVTRAEPLPPPALPPTFDAATAHALATELATLHPNRSPGSAGARGAARWVTRQLRAYGLDVRRQTFEATIPGRGRVRLANLVAEAPGRSRDTIVVMAHRDDAGAGEGANDNASGTAVLIELARAYAHVPARAAAPGTRVRPARTIVFLSSDGGAFGGLGADRFARDRAYRGRIVAVINLDSVGGRARARVVFTGDSPRSPDPTLLQTAAARVLDQAGQEPSRASVLEQLVDLGFPFSLYEQAPFVARGVAAVTLTTARDRPPPAFADSVVHRGPLDATGRSAQALLGSLDEALAVPGGSAGFVYLGPSLVRGWAVQLVLIAALLPFFAAVIDLFARCRRRRVPLGAAFRSFRSRGAFWLFCGCGFAALAALGVWPQGAARPVSLESDVAGDWPLLGLGVLGAVAAGAWLVTRERLLPRRRVESTEELAGYTAALLALGVLALVVVATNVYALLFLLPSLHAWLWLPQVRERRASVRLAVLACGFAGPLLLLGSFAMRYELGLDAPWYVAQLAALGYVEPVAVAAFLLWAAATAQLAALTVRRYAPYPTAAERPPRGPFRELVRRGALAVRRRRARATPVELEALDG